MRLPKIILLFFILFLLLKPAPVFAAEGISAYFTASDCNGGQMITKPGDLPQGNASLNLCFDTGTASVTGFDIKINCSGSINCIKITDGRDANKFDFSPDGQFNVTSNIITWGKIINIPPERVSGKLHIATIDLNITKNTEANIKFDQSSITSSPTVANTFYSITNSNTPGGGIGARSSNKFSNGPWVPDSEVTFAGKMAARANDFLSWSLKNYDWSKVDSSRGENPFSSFWSSILKIVYAFSLLLVLISAFVMIMTRGRSLTIMRFIPRFILVLLLATFSFTLIQFLYQFVDIVQGFFLKRPDGGIITAKDLLNMDFGYKDFVGYRMEGAANDESVFVSLLLVKLTALTYYIMSGILLVRKVILWFFIIVSPVFPFLLLYSPVRNTAKIWIGEFFRWLLYAPIFAIFLSGLVSFWTVYIPMLFNFSSANDSNSIVYPTAINILLGGPGQDVTKINSVNLPDTFVLYIVSLLMLWAVIILPFILLRIFLDYVFNLSVNDTSMFKQFVNTTFPLFNKYGNLKPPQPPISPNPMPPSTGLARALPFINKLPEQIVNKIPHQIPVNQGNQSFADLGTKWTTGSMQKMPLSVPQMMGSRQTVDRTKDILKSINVSVPTLRDIARFETSILSKDNKKQEEVRSLINRLEKVVNPATITNLSEVHQYNNVKDQLVNESKINNNNFASTILSAASKVVEHKQISQVTDRLNKILNPSSVSTPSERLQFTEVRDRLVRESNNNNTLASTVLSTINNISSLSTSKERQTSVTESLIEKLTIEKEKGNELASTVLSTVAPSRTSSTNVSFGTRSINGTAQTPFPVVNRVQTVSLEDYEAVREMWEENYKKLEPPMNMTGVQFNRKEWIESDLEKISETTTLLTSSDPRKVDDGMKLVGEILPFLLIGGFSQTEIIAYLKAKMQAGKNVLEDINEKEEEEETQVSVEKNKKEESKEMSAENEEKIEDKKLA